MTTFIFAFITPTEREKRIIEQTLGLPCGPSTFGIVDRLDNLIMLHYNTEKISELTRELDPETLIKILKIRGLVMDSNTGRIVCNSFGYTPDAIYDSLPTDTLKDVNGNDLSYMLSEETTEYSPALEGTMLRAWKYNNKVYFSTHRKINPIRSSFGNSKWFHEIYSYLEGPNGDALFNPNFSSSNITHCFLMCTKSLLIVSKINTGDGFITYLGPLVNDDNVNDNNTDMGSYWTGQVFELETNNTNIVYPKGDAKDRFIWVPTKLNKNQVNHVLSYGPFALDEHKNKIDHAASLLSVLRTGEPVMAIKKNVDTKKIISMCRIVPNCYLQKLEITDKNPNIFNRSC